ncbi:MAG: hypothetical protein EXR51_11925 [Dehalococcoidia bacterium]|nr:hypothetical protein [Dehalococcoidia bacterium]
MRDGLALLTLLALAALFNAPLAFGNGILTDYDLYNYFYPYWQYRADLLRAGQLPLWNPYLFTGVPLLANSQVGVFYLPNQLVLGLDAPRAVASAYLQHLCLAGAGAYLFLRLTVRLGSIGAFGGAAVFALSGFFASQAGHINQVQAAAWTPWIAVAFQQAYARRHVLWLAAAGVFLAVQLTAGHPQESYMTLVVVAGLAGYETLLTAVRETGHEGRPLPLRLLYPVRMLLRFAGASLFTAVLLSATMLLGAGLAAVQLLPTLELQRESIRAAGLTYKEAVSFSFPPWDVLKAFLPVDRDLPFGEHYVYVGAAALTTALLGPHWWRPRAHTYFFLILVVAGLFLALGGYNPAFPWLYSTVPGVGLFRVPARWLFVVLFGLSGLTAIGLDTLVRNGLGHLSRLRLSASVLTLFGSIAAVGISGYAGRSLLSWPAPEVVQWWLAAGLVGVVGVTTLPYFLHGGVAAAMLLVVMGAELLFGRQDLPVMHPVPAQAYTDLRPALTRLMQDPGTFRALSLVNTGYIPGDWPSLQGELSATLSTQTAEDYGVAIKNNESLAPNQGLRFRVPSLDGYDGGLLPLKQWGPFKEMLLDSGGARAQIDRAPAALIRDHISGIPDPWLLGWLNVKYVVMDRLNDAWVDGVYHDLGTTVRLTGAQPFRFQQWEPVIATHVSVATYLENAAHVPQGTPVARVVVEGAEGEGEPRTWVLRAGVDTADSEGVPLTGVRHLIPRPAAARRDLPTGRTYATRLDLGGVFRPKSFQIESLVNQEVLGVAGVAWIDDRTGASTSAPLDARLKRVHTGDLKVYQNESALPRAFIATDVQWLEGEAALRALPKLLPGQVLLPPEPGGAAGPSAGPGLSQAAIAEYAPERVVIDAETQAGGYLVLTDSHYPGWRAWVDGQETAILRANVLFRAVLLPPGPHRVEFRFEPASLRWGALVSVATAVGLALALLAWVFTWSAVLSLRWLHTGPWVVTAAGAALAGALAQVKRLRRRRRR